MTETVVELQENVVLLDELGRVTGSMPKAAVHGTDTPLHLAFSCYVVNADNEVLLTRRALTKPTWPGELTNSCCGHPLPGEDIADAVRRRLPAELGLRARSVDLVLPGFRYRAQMANGIVENELCPVFRVTADGELSPDPDEVHWAGWLRWNDLVDGVRAATLDVSPWCREQVHQLSALGADPSAWPVADAAGLPPAARPR